MLKFNLNIKKLIILSLLLLIIFFSLRNLYSTIGQFTLANIAIRESFYDKNFLMIDPNNDGVLDFVDKGTHEGGEDYFKKINKYINLLKNLKFLEFYNVVKNLLIIDYKKTNFYNEYILIKKLENYYNLPEKYKFTTGIYIDKSNRVFWDLSCDRLMIPFVVPAISNIALISGLPEYPWEKSCFGNLSGYGYGRYKDTFNQNVQLTEDELCKFAKVDNFKNVIKIYINSKNNIVDKIIKCE